MVKGRLKFLGFIFVMMVRNINADQFDDALELYKKLHQADQQVLTVGQNVEQYEKISDSLHQKAHQLTGVAWEGQLHVDKRLVIQSSFVLKHMVIPREQLICAEVRQEFKEYLERRYGAEQFLRFLAVSKNMQKSNKAG